MLVDIMKAKDEGALKALIEEELSRNYDQSILLSNPLSVYDEWMRYAIRNIKEEPIRETKHGLIYKDYEFSDLYQYKKDIDYRIPNGFEIGGYGIKKLKVLILANPIIPVSMLVIDNNRYPPYYKFKNVLTGNIFTSNIQDLRVSKKVALLFEEYLTKCLVYNCPDKISTVMY